MFLQLLSGTTWREFVNSDQCPTNIRMDNENVYVETTYSVNAQSNPRIKGDDVIKNIEYKMGVNDELPEL